MTSRLAQMFRSVVKGSRSKDTTHQADCSSKCRASKCRIPNLVDLSILFCLLGLSTACSTANKAKPPSAVTVDDTVPLGIAGLALPEVGVGIVYAATLSAAGGTAPYQWSVASGTLPSGIDLQTSSGTITGLTNSSGTFPFTAKVTDSSGQTAMQAFVLNVSLKLAIADTALVEVDSGIVYASWLSATGGVTPYQWSVASGALPFGMQLQPSGAITGMTSLTGNYPFTAKVTDSSGQSATGAFALTVTPTLGINETALAPADATIAYAASLLASGGITPYQWSLETGTLPSGIELKISGIIAGMTSLAGAYSFTAKVTDSSGQSATSSFALTVAPTLAIANTALIPAEPDVAYAVPLSATGGITPYEWSLGSGTLPSGMELQTSTGTITGITRVTGTYPFTAKVTDSFGKSALLPLILSVCGPPLYSCSSISTEVVQTPSTAPFSGTTGYNQVASDTSLNPSGVDPIVRVTDSTMLGGHSPSSTFSGGDNDLGFSCTGTSNSMACQNATLYYYTATYGGTAFFEGLEFINGVPQVVAPFPASGTPSFIPNGAPAFSSTNPALAYEEIGSNGAGGVPTIKQIALSWSGTVGQSPTLSESQLYSLAASCAPLPNGYGYGQTYSGLLSHDVTDNIFGIDLSNVRGFGTGIYLATVANGSTSVTFATTTIGQAVAHTGAAGTGYVLGDVITPTQSGSNGVGQLVVTGVGAGGVVTGLAVYAPGKNYSTAAGLATTGGTGTGLQVDITIGMLTGGSYTNAAIKLNGVEYTIASNTLTRIILTSGFSGTACATSCSMSVASGQGTGQQIVFVQLSPAACQVINTYNGTSQATGAWAGTGNGNLTGPCPQMYVHEGNIQGNGIWGTYSNGGSGCGNSLVLFEVGTLNSIPCTAESTNNPVSASLCFGHLNVGYKSFSIIDNPSFFNLLPQNVGSSTPVAPFGSVPPSALGGNAANCENHFSWRNATAAETQMTIGGTANNNYSTSASTSTWSYPGMNENYGLDASGVMHRFGHNFILGPGNGAGCGTTNAGPFDYYFNGQYGIGTVSPDGRLWAFSSSMLGQLGTDVTGNLRQDNFMIALQ